MSGGTIANCIGDNGGGVRIYTSKEFIMNGGTIVGCSASSGGAVHASGADKVFTMIDGTISQCTSSGYGGAIFVIDGGISLKGGTISSCTAASMGGAVMAWEGQVDMSGGLIDGCKAPNGGGVYIYLGASMTMSGGTIANCSGDNGGGIRIHNANGLTMTGGNINKCNAEKGGGLYTEVAQSVTLEGGTISACQAEYGGAIYAKGAQAVTMKAGTLTGCTASASGGGVYYAAGTLAMAGDGVVKDNLAATAGNLAASNIYLEDGCVLEISGALASGAIIGVSCANPADDRVIARGSGGYSLTAGDAEKFLADFADYQVGLNDAGQAVLQKVVSFNVAVEKEGQGEMTCVYAGLGEAVITLTPAEGFKLTALYVGEQQVPEEQIKPDETDLRSSIYTFTPTANVVVKAVFQAVSGEDLNDKIETVLPDLDDPLKPEEIDTILELKAEYEALPAADKKQINADKLHEALGAIDSISVVVVNAEGVPAKVAEPNALLYEMSYDEAMMLKTGKITEYKLIVTVNALGPFAVTQE